MRSSRASALDHPLIFLMRTDPIPQQSTINFGADCSIVQGHADAPEMTNFLQVKRRMLRVVAKQAVLFSRL
jgi:hypothetical protein